MYACVCLCVSINYRISMVNYYPDRSESMPNDFEAAFLPNVVLTKAAIITETK